MTNGVDLSSGHILDIQASYKYLGIPRYGNHDEQARKEIYLRLLKDKTNLEEPAQ